jgi:hypothetical protein
MPERGQLQRPDEPDNTERLNRAIDRLTAGQPTPVLGDPQLQELLGIAQRLHNELPRDLPDPVFRASLKEQLLTDRPVAIQRGREASRFPYATAISAIASVLVAAIAVGSLGIWMNQDDDDDPPVQQGNVLTVPSRALTASVLAAATMTVADTTAVVPETASTSESSTMLTTVEPTSSTIDPTPTQPAGATATAEPGVDTPTPEEPDGPVLADVPPVDAEHYEPGPSPAVEGGGEGPSDDVTYELMTDLPELDVSAPVYRLVPPAADPAAFVAAVAASLALEGEVTSAEDARRRTQYSVVTENDGSFFWTPETGAFQYSGPGIATAEVSDAAAAIDAAHAWLASVGYPVDRLAPGVDVQPSADGTSYLVSTRYEAVPQPGIGRPLGVTLVVTSEGAVTEASGFWLEVSATEEAALVSADEAWQAVASGEGYWTGGGVASGGGAFRVDSIRITYFLTKNDGELVLQPVVEAMGNFESADGNASARIRCFVQAAKTTAP